MLARNSLDLVSFPSQTPMSEVNTKVGFPPRNIATEILLRSRGGVRLGSLWATLGLLRGKREDPEIEAEYICPARSGTRARSWQSLHRARAVLCCSHPSVEHRAARTEYRLESLFVESDKGAPRSVCKRTGCGQWEPLPHSSQQCSQIWDQGIAGSSAQHGVPGPQARLTKLVLLWDPALENMRP